LTPVLLRFRGAQAQMTIDIAKNHQPGRAMSVLPPDFDTLAIKY
jgi:hypothetical protein